MGTGAQNEMDGRVRFDQIIPNRILRWTLYAAAWTIIGLVNFGSALLGMRRVAPDFPAWPPLTWELSSAYVIGLGLVPLLVWVTHRLEFRHGTWLRSLIAHFLLTVPFSLLHVAGMVTIRKAVYWLHGASYNFGNGNLLRELLFEYYNDIQTYWIIVLVTLGFEYYNRYRERGLRLAQAQLQNLRDQLNPHFLFNTLNMISSKMYEDVGQADVMITRLSDLLRLTLRTSSQPEVPLQADLEALDLYLDIMKARFAEEIRIEVNVEPAARDALAPSLILQPLVENAFRHGVAQITEGAQIRISAAVNDHTLVLRVSDNGPGFRAARPNLLSRGFGLSNTASRLQQLYGDRHSLEFRNCSEGGAEVVIQIPYRSA